jgi:hypothetical protein
VTRLLLDTNVLLLAIVGAVDREGIGRHRRLQPFGPADVDLLYELITAARSVSVTPNIWTEVSNLIGLDRIKGPIRRDLLVALRQGIDTLPEIYVSSKEVASDYAFQDLGLSDTVILKVLAIDSETTLLTIDAPLYQHARSRGLSVLNFHHLREVRGIV